MCYAVFHTVAFYFPIRNAQKFQLTDLRGSQVKWLNVSTWGHVGGIESARVLVTVDLTQNWFPAQESFLSATITSCPEAVSASTLRWHRTLPSRDLSVSGLRLPTLFAVTNQKILISTNSPKPLAASNFPGIGDLPGYDWDFHLGGVWTSESGLEYQVLECDAGKLWAPSLVG